MSSLVVLFIPVLVIVASILLGFVRSRNVNYEIYTGDPGQYSWYIIAITLLGTICGGGMFLVVGQMGYEAGILGYIIGFIYLVGLSIVAFFADKLKPMMEGKKHLLEVIKEKYDSYVMSIFAFVSFLLYLFLLSGQFLSIHMFADFISSSYPQLPKQMIYAVFLLSVISMLLYPVIGGLRKDITTDLLQVFVIIVASLFIALMLFRTDMLNRISELPDTHLSGTGYGPLFTIGAIIFLTPSFLVRMDIWQRISAARKDRDCQIGFVLAAIGSLLFYVLFTTLGIWGYLSKTKDSQYVALSVINDGFGSGILGSLVFGAFFAAVLSTADTIINNISIFATEMLFHDKKDDQKIKSARVISIVAIVVSIMLAFAAPSLVDLMVGAFSLILIFLPIVIGLLVENWRTVKGAIWSPIVGVVLFLLLFFLWSPKVAFAPVVVVSGIVYTAFLLVERFFRKSERLPSGENQVSSSNENQTQFARPDQ